MMSCSSTGVSISSRSGVWSSLPVKLSWSASSHAGTATTFSTAPTMGSRPRLFSLTVRTSPGFRSAEGILCLRPLRRKWPWTTSWRAWGRLLAKPIRKTTLSIRSSICLSRLSRETPCLPAAAWEAQREDDVVHPELHLPEQVRARDALHPGRLVVGPPKLLLGDPVVPARLLLLEQAPPVLRLPLASPPVLAGGIRLLLKRVLAHR